MKIAITRGWQLLLLLCGAFGLGYSMGTGNVPILIGAAAVFVLVIVTAPRATEPSVREGK